jgi:hypothetical protein
MTATAAGIGFKSKFAIEGGTPAAYANVAEVVRITPPGASRSAIKATHLDSPGDTHEYIAGIIDGGEASITVNFVPSATDTLRAAFTAGKGKYQITFPNGVRLQFGGIVTAWTPPELTDEGKMELTMTIKQSGAATLLASL